MKGDKTMDEKTAQELQTLLNYVGHLIKQYDTKNQQAAEAANNAQTATTRAVETRRALCYAAFSGDLENIRDNLRITMNEAADRNSKREG